MTSTLVDFMRSLTRSIGVTKITEEDAYEMYLESGLENIMPFRSKYDFDYIDYLEQNHIAVINEN